MVTTFVGISTFVGSTAPALYTYESSTGTFIISLFLDKQRNHKNE